MFAGRARKRPRRARHLDDRMVGNHQRHLARVQRTFLGRPGVEQSRRAIRVGQVPLAPVARRDDRHRVAGRRVLLHAAWHLPRTRRQHRADSRRAFRRRRTEFTRRRAPARRLLLLDLDSQFGVGAGDLSQGVSRCRHAGAGGRIDDPEPADAALAARFARRRLHESGDAAHAQARTSASGSPASCAPSWCIPTSGRFSKPACTPI